VKKKRAGQGWLSEPSFSAATYSTWKNIWRDRTHANARQLEQY
jgi:hypothetical protein